jgi:hypothetical protein
MVLILSFFYAASCIQISGGAERGQKEHPEDGWIIQTLMGPSREVLQIFSNIICYCASGFSMEFLNVGFTHYL